MDLDFSVLRGSNVARCDRSFPGGLDTWSNAEWLTAIAGEIGEAQNIVKKINRDRLGLVGNKGGEIEQVLRAKLGAELADAVIYLDLFAAKKAVDLLEALDLEAERLPQTQFCSIPRARANTRRYRRLSRGLSNSRRQI